MELIEHAVWTNKVSDNIEDEVGVLEGKDQGRG